MRLLMLPRYGAIGASGRLRMLQYVPALQSSGINVEVSPLLEDSYVRDLYAGTVSIPDVLRSNWRRLRSMQSVHRFDVDWMEKESEIWSTQRWIRTVLLRCASVSA